MKPEEIAEALATDQNLYQATTQLLERRGLPLLPARKLRPALREEGGVVCDDCGVPFLTMEGMGKSREAEGVIMQGQFFSGIDSEGNPQGELDQNSNGPWAFCWRCLGKRIGIPTETQERSDLIANQEQERWREACDNWLEEHPPTMYCMRYKTGKVHLFADWTTIANPPRLILHAPICQSQGWGITPENSTSLSSFPELQEICKHCVRKASEFQRWALSPEGPYEPWPERTRPSDFWFLQQGVPTTVGPSHHLTRINGNFRVLPNGMHAIDANTRVNTGTM